MGNQNNEYNQDLKESEVIKAEAEALEAEIKALEGDDKGNDDGAAGEGDKEAELVNNYSIRKQKAEERLEAIRAAKGATQAQQLSASDIQTLTRHDIDVESEEAKVLQSYVDAGKVSNLKEALTHPGAKAEVAALQEARTTASVIDGNDNDDVTLNTQKEIANRYEAAGEVPDNPTEQAKLAEDNLARMGL